MPSTDSPPILADAADVLSDQLREHLKRLSALIKPHTAYLDERPALRAQLEAVTPSPRRRATRTAGALDQPGRRVSGDSVERHPGELPTPHSRMIGRERETTAVQHLLRAYVCSRPRRSSHGWNDDCRS